MVTIMLGLVVVAEVDVISPAPDDDDDMAL